jgi:hypothetical protein
MRLIHGIAAGAATLLVLAGCAPVSPNPASTGDPVPGSSETPAASLLVPDVRSSANCAALVDIEALGNWFDIDRTVDESAPVDDLDAVAVRTSQALRCAWEGDLDSDYGYPSSYLTLLVRPVTDDGDAYRDATQYLIEDNYTEFDTAGDDSAFYCSSYGERWSCAGDMLVGDYWVGAALQASTESPLPESKAKQRMQNTLQRISAKLRNAPLTGTAWVRPAGAVTGEGICSGDSKAGRQIIADAFGLTKVKASGGDVYMTDYTTYNLTDSVQCDFYAGKVFIDVALVPGAAWWGDSWDAVDLRYYKLTGFEPVDVDGIDRAMVACSDGDCSAYLISEGSAVFFQVHHLKRDRFIAGLASIPQLISL